VTVVEPEKYRLLHALLLSPKAGRLIDFQRSFITSIFIFHRFSQI
jgi:hypothetical protein